MICIRYYIRIAIPSTLYNNNDSNNIINTSENILSFSVYTGLLNEHPLAIQTSKKYNSSTARVERLFSLKSLRN
jgi:hypothetical protein